MFHLYDSDPQKCNETLKKNSPTLVNSKVIMRLCVLVFIKGMFIIIIIILFIHSNHI